MSVSSLDAACGTEGPAYGRLLGLGWAHFLNDGAANYLPGVLPAVLVSMGLSVSLAGTLMAALAHQLPIVSTRPPIDLPELIHGENVWLVPPKDPNALATAIAALSADRERRSVGH